MGSRSGLEFALLNTITMAHSTLSMASARFKCGRVASRSALKSSFCLIMLSTSEGERRRAAQYNEKWSALDAIGFAEAWIEEIHLH